MADLAALGGLFVVAFGAATFLPFQSEFAFVALALRQEPAYWAVLATASVGNTMGSQANWALGRFVEHLGHARWFPASPDQLARAQGWYARWGVWTLLLSWAPFGDVTTIVAGMMRTPFWLFTLIVGAVKTARYALLGAFL